MQTKPTLAPTSCAVALLLLLALPAVVQAQFTWTTNNGAVTITGYYGPGGAVVIPAVIVGLPVTCIGEWAFLQQYTLTSVSIPDSVLSLEWNAFYRCTNLTSVSIGNSVTNLGESAFCYCTRLADVTLPDSVTGIGPQAFYFCSSLTNVTIPNSVTSIGRHAFYACTSLTNVAIPNSVTSIGTEAFSGCTNLAKVTIGNGVTSIEVGTFMGCTSLSDVTISNSVTSIGHFAFYLCTSLAKVTIPGSVTYIGDRAYAGCASLYGAYFQGNAPICEWSAFEYNDNVIVYYLPGAKGWGAYLGGRPTALWRPQIQTGDSSFGVRTNQFGFNIAWASGQTVVVDACTDLGNPIWSSLKTNTFSSDSLYFSDPQWTNHPSRFYRLRSP